MKLAVQNKKNLQGGLLLLECLVYLSISMVILGLAFAIFYQCQTQSVRLRRQTEHVAISLRFGERWRDEIRHATSAPFVTTTNNSTSLHIPTASGEVIYLYDGMDIYRKDANSETFLLFVESIRSLAFIKENRSATEGWRLELELMSYEKSPRIRPLFTFLAVHPG